jgi:hypothetical protein
MLCNETKAQSGMGETVLDALFAAGGQHIPTLHASARGPELSIRPYIRPCCDVAGWLTATVGSVLKRLTVHSVSHMCQLLRMQIIKSETTRTGRAMTGTNEAQSVNAFSLMCGKKQGRVDLWEWTTHSTGQQCSGRNHDGWLMKPLSRLLICALLGNRIRQGPTGGHTGGLTQAGRVRATTTINHAHESCDRHIHVPFSKGRSPLFLCPWRSLRVRNEKETKTKVLLYIMAQSFCASRRGGENLDVTHRLPNQKSHQMRRLVSCSPAHETCLLVKSGSKEQGWCEVLATSP